MQVDLLITDQTRQVDAGLAYDSQEPQRIGGAHLLDNYAQNGWDLGAQAQLARRAGSMYLSLHLPWHYNLMNGEIDRPLYHQVCTRASTTMGCG